MKKKQGGLPRRKRKCKEKEGYVTLFFFFWCVCFHIQVHVHVGLKNGGVSGGSGEEYLASTCIFGKLHIHRENYGTDYMKFMCVATSYVHSMLLHYRISFATTK